MHAKFREAVESLHPKLVQLINSAPHKVGDRLPLAGVYLFCEGGEALYVGRSNNIPRRYGNHRNLGSNLNQAAFAVLLARESLGRRADYRAGPNTRAALANDHVFMDAFSRAKARVRGMEFRAVSESDQTRQALLEIYCAVALDARYNDFRNH